jgi:hypothetical protein
MRALAPRGAGAALLAALPLPAYAQYVPPQLVAMALSPILVLVLCAVLGIAARSARAWLLHSALVIAWVLLFLLAAYFVENDYVIWTPIVLYVAHAALVLALIFVAIFRRRARGAGEI